MRRAAIVVASTSASAGVVMLVTAATQWPDAPPEFHTAFQTSAADVVAPIKAGFGAGLTVRSSALDDLQPRSQPTSISVPSLHIKLPVLALGLNPEGGLELPDTSLKAAWYRYGGVPGKTGDAALIAAHVDNARTGVGPFARLRDVQPGAKVAVAMSDGTKAMYTVVGAEQRAKQGLDFERLLDDGPGMLVLVTCGGRFDASTGHYEDNVIVWAVPVDLAWDAP